MGGNTHFSGINLRQLAEEEIADLIAACYYTIGANFLNRKLIKERSDAKLKLFEQWHYEVKSKNLQEVAN